MCLAIPGCVEQLLEQQQAIVNIGGVRKQVSLALLDQVHVGDYVIVHVGFALQVLNEAEAAETLALFAGRD